MGRWTDGHRRLLGTAPAAPRPADALVPGMSLSAPPPADEPRSPRPHSYRSTVAMLRDEAAEDAADALAEDDAGYDALDDDEINELRAAQRGGESFFDMMLRVGRRKQE